MSSETPELLRDGGGWQIWSKPSGFTVHNEPPSLADFLSGKGMNASFVNRLDKETSGLVVTARDPATHARLQGLWQAPTTRKFYIGLHRKPRASVPEDIWWEDSLTDRSEGRKNPRGIASDRVPARTRFRRLAETAHLILSAVEIETGRQHQIRKHAAIHGVELIGDERYGDPKYLGNLRRHLPFLRLGLHAAGLLWIPEGKQEVVFSPLPDFFSEAFPDAQIHVRAFLDSANLSGL